MKLISLLALIFALSLPPGIASAAILLDDHFTDGSRTDQNLPSSAAYYFGATSANGSVGVTSNAMQLSYSSGSGILSQVVAYFTASGAPITLAVGDKLSTSIALTATGISNTADTLRFGLFNSGGSRVNADYSGVASATFNAYTGYSLFSNLSSSGTNTTTIRQRTGTNNTLYSSTANANLRSGLAPLGYAAATTYTLSFELDYVSASNLKVTFSDSKGTLYTSNDTVSPFTTFDTFALFLTNGDVSPQTYTIDDIVVTYTQVPEPAMLLLPGVAVLLLFHRSRRTGLAV